MINKIHVLKNVEKGESDGDGKTLKFQSEPRVIDLPEETKTDLSGGLTSQRDVVDYTRIDEMTVRYREKEKRRMK